MSSAFIRCAACGQVVRRVGTSCPECREIFGKPGAGLSSQGRAILNAIKDGPVAGPTIAEKLSSLHDVIYAELAQLEADGLVVTYLREPGEQPEHPSRSIYLITELGRDIVEQWDIGTAPDPLPRYGGRSTKMTVTIGALLISRGRRSAEHRLGRSGAVHQPQFSL